MSGHTKEPWRACKNGECSCGMIWGDDAHIATVTVGEWGDEFADIRLVDEPGTIGNKAEPFINRITYGAIPEQEAKANARRICLAVNACASLSDSALESGVIERVRAVLQELTDDLERRYAEKDRGARNYLGDIVGKANKEALEAMSQQLARAKEALALLEAKP